MTSVTPRWPCLLVLLLSVLVLSTSVVASKLAETPDSKGESEFNPVYKPELKIMRATGPIEVDGALDDVGWKNAASSEMFVERRPGDMIPPDVYTRLMVTYDNEKLYIAFSCEDDPADIRATMCQRDQFNGNDAVIVLIDTYGDASWAYELFVNPYGVQKDYLWTSVAGEDPSFDLIWEAAARQTSDGYQVEIAVPFSSMRFPSRNVQQWRMDFWRNRPREVFKQYSWSAYDRGEQCWPCQWGTVSGIGDVEPGKGIELLPTVLATQSGRLGPDPSTSSAGFNNDDIKAELALGGKYALSSDFTIEAALNPDFSQIEADAAQINVNSTIALFYPERRPFFQEGADIFRTLFNSFYTRTVNDPQFAAKMTGRMGSRSLGILAARDEHTPYVIPLEEGTIVLSGEKSTVNVVRGYQAFGDNSRVGFMFTDRRFEEGGYGTILSLDGDVRLSRNYSIVGQVVQSYTKEPVYRDQPSWLGGMELPDKEHSALLDGESFSGRALISQLRRRGRHLNFHMSYDQVDPGYRTQTGYDPWVNYRNGVADVSFTFYPDSRIFELITPDVHVSRRWNLDGDIKWSHLYTSLRTRLRFAQTYFNVSYGQSEEQWSGVNYKGLWEVRVDAGSQSSDEVGVDASVTRSRGVAILAGLYGYEWSGRFGLDLKPIDRVVIEPSVGFTRATETETGIELFEQVVARTRLRYQANRELSVRLVVQYNSGEKKWNVDPLLTYRLSPFSVFYVGSTYDYRELPQSLGQPDEWRLSSRQFFMKLQYLFQT